MVISKHSVYQGVVIRKGFKSLAEMRLRPTNLQYSDKPKNAFFPQVVLVQKARSQPGHHTSIILLINKVIAYIIRGCQEFSINIVFLPIQDRLPFLISNYPAKGIFLNLDRDFP
jgi:hypothetical protein